MLFINYYYSGLKLNLINLNYFKLKKVLIIIYINFFNFLSLIIFKLNNIYLILNNNNIYYLFFIFRNLFSLNFSQLLDIIIVDRLEMNLYEKRRFNYFYVLVSIF